MNNKIRVNKSVIIKMISEIRSGVLARKRLIKESVIPMSAQISVGKESLLFIQFKRMYLAGFRTTGTVSNM